MKLSCDETPPVPQQSDPVAAATTHPEDTCQRCGGANVTWFTDNALWNRVVGESGILCPSCFVQLAETKGINAAWKLMPEVVPPSPAPAGPTPDVESAVFYAWANTATDEQSEEVVRADIARDLSRQRDEARKERDNLQVKVYRFIEEIDALSSLQSQATRDAEEIKRLKEQNKETSKQLVNLCISLSSYCKWRREPDKFLGEPILHEHHLLLAMDYIKPLWDGLGFTYGLGVMFDDERIQSLREWHEERAKQLEAGKLSNNSLRSALSATPESMSTDQI